MSNNRKQQAEYDIRNNNKKVRGKLLWSVLNKWRRNNFDWDLSRSAYKKKIEKIIDKLTKEENGQPILCVS